VFSNWPAPPRTGDLWITLAVVSGYVIGYLSPFSMAVVVGSMMQELDLSERAVGVVVGVELLFIAIAAAALSAMSRAPDLRLQAVVGAVLALVGHAIVVVSDSLPLLLLARAIAGLGEGVVLSAANRLGATQLNPDRHFAFGQVGISVFTMVMVVTVPLFIDQYGYRAASFGLLLVICLWAPVLIRFPDACPEEVSEEECSNGSVQFPFKRHGILVLSAFALMSIADVGMWIFVERIGALIGVATERVGLLLAGATALGLLGALGAAVIGSRWGRLRPMLFGLIALALANLGVVYASNLALYATSLMPLNMAILFLTPFFLGTLSVLDPRGSWTIASGILIPMSFSVAPVLIGAVAAAGSYIAVGWATSGCALVAMVLMVYVHLHPASSLSGSTGT
jgi:MFS family permease